MAFFTDSVLLLDRNTQSRTLSSDITNGDLTPWRVRLELVNTAEDGVDNSGTLTLRIDENKTFIKTGPLLMEEDAKTKYLIECKITQSIGGSNVDSKVFRFQIGTPQVTVDQQSGGLLKIQLQEIQRRTQEVYTSRELRFLTPSQALDERLWDFRDFERSWGYPTDNKPVSIHTTSTSNKLPTSPELEYVPQSPISVKEALDRMFANLKQSQAAGGVLTDFYYDYDPATDIDDPGAPLVTYLTADAVGRVDSGVVINPLSAEAIDAEEQQDANTDFFKYRNHVIGRGHPTGGSLPPEHSTYSSDWIHAKLRPEFDSSREVEDRAGNEWMYLKGDVVKRTFTIASFASTDARLDLRRNIDAKKLIRFFICQDNVLRTNTDNPEGNHVLWQEDFVMHPEFDKTGHYQAGDIVYFNVGNSLYPVYRFYQAKENIHDWTLNRYRYWEDEDGYDGTYPANSWDASLFSTGHLDSSTGFLHFPTHAQSGWFYPLPAPANDHTQSSQSYGWSFVYQLY